MSNNCTPNNAYDETKICERRIKTKNKPLKLRYLIKYNFVADPFNTYITLHGTSRIQQKTHVEKRRLMSSSQVKYICRSANKIN